MPLDTWNTLPVEDQHFPIPNLLSRRDTHNLQWDAKETKIAIIDY